MNVYEISHTLSNQSDYVAASNPVDAIDKLKKDFYENGNRHLNYEDVLSITKMGEIII